MVTVTVGDGEQGGVEDTKVDGEGSNNVLTMIVLSAASVCILEHSLIAIMRVININNNHQTYQTMSTDLVKHGIFLIPM